MSENLTIIKKDDSELQSLRIFLDSLPNSKKVTFYEKREDYLMSALVEEFEKEGLFPVIEMADPETKQKAVANIFGDRENLKSCVFNIIEVENKADEFCNFREIVNAPVHDIVIEKEDINILGLPIFKHFKADAGRYITSGIVIAKDPETKRNNFSFHRMQLKSNNRIGISLHSRGDLWRYFNVCEQRGKDLEVAVVIGTHPAYYIAGASKIPPSQDDYSWAGAYMNETPVVTKAKTVDIFVPAYAEYVIEGRILANTHEDEGPFGEYTGYNTSRSTRNVLEVTCITQRNDAIYQDLVPGFAWEHLLLSQFTKEIILLNKLRQEIPGVKQLCMPKNGCHFHAYLSIKKELEGQAKQAMLLLFGLDLYLKLIIVVDEDIDVFDEEQVIWAVATRMQADKDVFIVPNVTCNRLDPSSHNGLSAKMGIDATKPGDWDAQDIELPDDVRVRAKNMIKNVKIKL